MKDIRFHKCLKVQNNLKVLLFVNYKSTLIIKN